RNKATVVYDTILFKKTPDTRQLRCGVISENSISASSSTSSGPIHWRRSHKTVYDEYGEKELEKQEAEHAWKLRFRRLNGKANTLNILLVDQWLWYVLDTLAVLNQKIGWIHLPGYAQVLKVFFLELKTQKSGWLPPALYKLSCTLLSNPNLINPMAKSLLSSMNVHDITAVIGSVELLGDDLYSTPAGNEVSLLLPSFDFRFLFSALRILMESEHTQKYIDQQAHDGSLLRTKQPLKATWKKGVLLKQGFIYKNTWKQKCFSLQNNKLEYTDTENVDSEYRKFTLCSPTYEDQREWIEVFTQNAAAETAVKKTDEQFSQMDVTEVIGKLESLAGKHNAEAIPDNPLSYSARAVK
uniref:PH domain-containing protein n=1 Tax=Globisporangium ultimum (strain ATCC 200006 / CBS 805.95 / DAOM BR144) TaxID=431595 RepID=K3WDC9_GLOUD